MRRLPLTPAEEEAHLQALRAPGPTFGVDAAGHTWVRLNDGTVVTITVGPPR